VAGDADTKLYDTDVDGAITDGIVEFANAGTPVLETKVIGLVTVVLPLATTTLKL
jgi:hypothetical protein